MTAVLNGSMASAHDLECLALTNYGHFTSMRVEDDGGIRGLTLHLSRLSQDSETVFGVRLKPGRVLEELRLAISQQNCPITVRVTVFDPQLTMNAISDPATPQLLITTRPAGHMPPPPLTAKSFTFSRDMPLVKHIGLFNQLHLRRAAQVAGFGDAVFVEPDGSFSEGATWNLGFIDADGLVVWPDGPALPGTTMRLLQAAHGDTVVRPVTRDLLPQMRAAFATNVSVGVRSIRAIDDVEFDVDHSALDLLRKVYAEVPTERP